MAFDFGSLLQQYMGGAQNADSTQIENDFRQVSQHAPRADIGRGVAEALRSDQTPPFSQMIGQLFGHGDANQRAGMLNQLIGGLSPGLLASLGGGLGSLFGNSANGASGANLGTGAMPQISPEQAAQLDAAQVQQIADHAQQQDPSIVDRMGDFYAAHPTLVHTIGSAAMAIAMGKIAERMRS